MNFSKGIVYIFLLTLINLQSQNLRVSNNGRFLEKENGEPFFWMADTAWELFHRCSLEESEMYLKKRQEQGFNVVQAVALAELDGLNTPNFYGEIPIINNDPTQPNEAYFSHIDKIIQLADELGIYIALLPTWGDKLFKESWGIGPEIFNEINAAVYGEWIGNRYKNYDNIIWVIGGDRNPRNGSKDINIWNALAEGIVKGVGGYDKTFMTFHPQPKELGGSSTWFHQQKWLDLNMHQTGHCGNRPTYKNIQHDYNLIPTKPVLDGEPLYEDHPNCFNAKELGYSSADDIRRIMYWNVFAGACGQTYGCHDVWQMYKLDRKGVNGPLRPWPMALDLPMANQVKHLKSLMLSQAYYTRIPDQSMILDNQIEDQNYVIATRDSEGSYAMIYFPTGKRTKIDFTNLNGNNFETHWFDPRTGVKFKGPQINKNTQLITPPTKGKGNDWVLIVEILN
ncbi:glycoside hydrolase family 140 protein [Namhaeicola litoreus]|uniref:Glycoside hydrolase family 140 protein n=1 Tax=Namhaeicola litoreus TaxID=1052145 RepID=A0ABW3Y6Z1_9FLAO